MIFPRLFYGNMHTNTFGHKNTLSIDNIQEGRSLSSLECGNYHFERYMHSGVRRAALAEATLPTHWGRVTHICISKLTIIGSDNGLSPGRRQAII